MQTFCGENKSDSFKALSIILEAWDEGADQGIAPELMAYAALFTDAVANLARGLDARVRQGEFTICGTRQ